jgi:tetratricopeptide (TPR) repeat protein
MPCALALLILADIIHLRSGGQIEGRVVEEGAGYIKVQTALGTVEIDRFDIDRIEKKPWTPPPPKDPPKPKPRPEPPAAKPKDPPPKQEAWQKVKLETQYRDPFINFRMSFPKDWAASKTPGEKATVSFEGPKDGIYIPRVHIFIERPKKEFAEYVREHQDQLKANKEYSDLAIKSFEATTVGGRNVMLFAATFKEGIISSATLWYFLDAGERKFMLMFYTTEVLFGRYEPTIQAAMRSLRVFEEHAVDDAARARFRALYNAAAERHNEKKYSEAVKEFEKVAELVPNYPDLHNVIGRAATNAKDHKRALAAFEKAVALDPDNFEYAYNLSNLQVSQNKLADALKTAERACELEPFSEPAWTHKGFVLIKKRDFKKAREALTRAVELNPESASAHFWLGFAHEASDNAAEAEREYRETLKIDPKHEQAQAGLKRLKDE